VFWHVLNNPEAFCCATSHMMSVLGCAGKIQEVDFLPLQLPSTRRLFAGNGKHTQEFLITGSQLWEVYIFKVCDVSEFNYGSHLESQNQRVIWNISWYEEACVKPAVCTKNSAFVHDGGGGSFLTSL
jgi:hypothetical protein